MRGDVGVHADPLGGIEAPSGIIVAPDGDVWFTSIGNHRLGRVRPRTGVVETFVDPADRIRLPANIIPARDGRLWVTCLGSGMLASIDPSAEQPAATIVHHAHEDLERPVAIKSAPDGRLWFTLRGGAGGVGSLDPTADDPLRTLRVHRSPSIADPSALFADELGSIWWVNAATATIGHLRADAPAGIESHDLRGTAPGSPRAWASDGAGRLWLTAREPAGLVSFEPADPAGSAHRVGHPDLVAPDGIWLGGDGALWIADTEANRIVRHDPLATGDPWSFQGHPPQVAGPFDIKGDGGDHLWFTNKATGTIGRIACGGRGG